MRQDIELGLSFTERQISDLMLDYEHGAMQIPNLLIKLIGGLFSP